MVDSKEQMPKGEMITIPKQELKQLRHEHSELLYIVESFSMRVNTFPEDYDTRMIVLAQKARTLLRCITGQ